MGRHELPPPLQYALLRLGLSQPGKGALHRQRSRHGDDGLSQAQQAAQHQQLAGVDVHWQQRQHRTQGGECLGQCQGACLRGAEAGLRV
jgi:hypothetical protein